MVEYSKRLGKIEYEQFQRALDRFALGDLIEVAPIPFGEFGQNVFLTSTAGTYVLRGAPLFPSQFPHEQFSVDLLHERTEVPVPWPYRLDEDTAIFGWSYVIMPRLSGLQLSNPELLRQYSFEERLKIARAMANNLAHMQQLTWPFSGMYDLEQRTIVPFAGTYEEWILSRLRRNLHATLQYNDRTDESDVRWVEELLAARDEALCVSYEPCFVTHDYKEGNVVVMPDEQETDEWRVSGVFDLMGSHFGDGESDLSRQVFVYLLEDKRLAEAFLATYVQCRPPRPGFRDRFVVYMLDSCIMLWEYFQRTGPDWLDKQLRFRDWITGFILPDLQWPV